MDSAHRATVKELERPSKSFDTLLGAEWVVPRGDSDAFDRHCRE